MLATIVTPSLNGLQILAFIAVIIFLIGAGIAAWQKALLTVFLLGGLAFLAAAVLFSGTAV